MNIREAAKRGRLDLVGEHIDSASRPERLLLLGAVCGDFHSIKKGPQHVALAEVLIQTGVLPDEEMIHQAARSGCEPLVELLVTSVPDPGLRIASAAGMVERVQDMLSNHSTDASAQDPDGRTGLHFCCASAIDRGLPDADRSMGKIARLLLEAGAASDTAARCCGLENITPLVHACWTGGSPAIVRLLLERGANRSYLALWAAVGHFQRHGDGHYDLADILLEEGLDINHNEDRTLLHAFSAHGDARGVKWLIERGADVSAKAKDGATPLHAAARRNTGVKVVDLLLESGASEKAKDEEGRTPLDLAMEFGRRRVVAKLTDSEGAKR